jgi:hypothetical protein
VGWSGDKPNLHECFTALETRRKKYLCELETAVERIEALEFETAVERIEALEKEAREIRSRINTADL